MFDGFSDKDFDAYAPAKWRSNVYNRERLEVKQRLLPLATALASRLLGTDGAALEAAASIEHPALVNHKQVDAQHVYFSRGEAARRVLDTIIDRARGVASLLEDPTPQRSHVFLVLSLSVARVDVALRLHPEATVDRQNLLRKCQDPFELDRLLSLLLSLPPGYRVGLEPELVDTASLTRDALDAALKRFAAQPTSGLAPTSALWSVCRTHSREALLSAGPTAAQLLTDDLYALLPIYRFCAWARDNDFVSVREALEKNQTERRQKGISRGDEIRVVRGLFTGQKGVVQEVDARGVLRVLVEKRTLKLDASDVELRSAT